MQDYTDKELLEIFRDESKKHYAFNLIVRKYQQKVYYHIRRMVIDHDDSNDVAQNTFIKAWKGLNNFREDSQLFTWLYRIATNEALTFLKQKKTKFLIPFGDVENELNETLSSGTNINANKLEMKLQQAILTLPPQQRIVFNMRYYDEIKYEDMAVIMGLTTGSLKATYHHAVKKIEKYITER
ncbi:MAG: sigma-70 family RNA polymerase sigma factor [Bacteroidia bacterium]